MSALNANAYRERQVTTASRGQLLLMTYDGALRFLAEGKRAMSEQRYDVQSKNLTKAQDLLMELLCTLDHSVNPELAGALDRLYRFMHDRLVYANVYNDEKAVTEVSSLLSDLREAWAQADQSLRTHEPTLVGARPS